MFKPETRKLVIRVAEELGYRPNWIAKALRSGRFNGIGSFRVPTSTLARHARAAGGIHEAPREQDLPIVSGRYADETLVNKMIEPRVLREMTADGLISNYSPQVPEGLENLLAGISVPSWCG